MKTALIVIGTRPELIKLAPLVHCLESSHAFEPQVCFTGQHKDLIVDLASYFGLSPKYRLDMTTGTGCFVDGFSSGIARLQEVVRDLRPACVVAQGDTTSVLVASLVSFLNRIPLVHVEAGLRTGTLEEPWPEEYIRRVATLSATVHCAPTSRSKAALVQEGVKEENVYVTGNTVIDALLWTVERERSRSNQLAALYPFIADRDVVVVTCHRRESVGARLAGICTAIAAAAKRSSDVCFVVSVHPNPDVRTTVVECLSGISNVHLVDAMPYPHFVWLMDRSCLIVTDSGGVQEEAPSLGKRVLVLRNVTERPEAVETGHAVLIGTLPDDIESAISSELSNRCSVPSSRSDNPYGDGTASRKIVSVLEERFR